MRDESVLPFVPRTLVADDQPDVLTALRLLLKGEGYQIEAVTSPAGVLEALAGGCYDLLLMDLNYARDTTSGQEGMDLLSQIQTIDDTLPVVVMTGWGSIDLAVEAMRRGVRDFIQKPWDNTRLLDIVRNQIQYGIGLRTKRRLEREKGYAVARLREASSYQALQSLVLENLQKAIGCSTAVLFSRNSEESSFGPTAELGLPKEILTLPGIATDSVVVQALSVNPAGAALMREGNPVLAEISFLHQVQATALVPIRHQEELIGFISIGRKTSGLEYSPEELSFAAEMAVQMAHSLNNLRLRGQDREMVEAREIQQKLIPKDIPKIPGYEISDAWRPASVVSGDYFDVLKFGEDRLALCIGDVAGKGMPAALLMSNAQAAVRAFADASVMPQDLCEKVNRVVCSNITEYKFITFFYALLDARSRRLHYANAGHSPPILVRGDGRAYRLEEGGPVLGVFPDWQCASSSIELKPGDRILLFTDGLTEVRSSAGEEFGEKRLVELVVEKRSLSATQLQEAVMQAAVEFSNGHFLDDATAIVLAVE
jgi:serine phosphatase RsbU (regulator of sigma subunit)/FixJ family two-component response regulator